MRRIVTIAAGAGLILAPVLALAAQGQVQQGQASQGAQPNGAAAPGAGTAMEAAPGAPISDGTIGKAGAALRDVANLQQKYQGKMESATPEQKRGLGEQANAEAVQAIQSHGLSVQEYSRVVRTAQSDPLVKQRLLTAANSSQ